MNKFLNEIEVWKDWRWFRHLISWEDYKELLFKNGYILYRWEIE